MNIISVQPPRSIISCQSRSATNIILIISAWSLSFRYVSPSLRINSLLLPSTSSSLSTSDLPFSYTTSLCWLTTLTIHMQLPNSFTPSSKPTSFTNLSHHRLYPGLRTDSSHFMAEPSHSEHLVFVFLFSSLHFLVPCAVRYIKLAIPVSRWAHENRIVYRTVNTLTGPGA